MVKTSVLMTVHDREPEVLLATLRSLYRCGLSEAELVIVDDRSGMDYSWIRAYAEPRFASVKWIPTGEYDGFRVDGYGNPAHAFNVGLNICAGEKTIIMSSDVIATPGAVISVENYWKPGCMYTPTVIDMDTGWQYCGIQRPFPMPWFLVVPTAIAQSIGGWDETFLGGFCYEDNDFVARMVLETECIRVGWETASAPTVYHQSHPQPAYTEEPLVVEANARNRGICRAKWGGIPFDTELSVWTMKRKPDPLGCFRLEFDTFNLKDRILAAKV